MFDLSSLPVSGNVLIAAVLYAGVSVYAGQEVATRSIDKSGWHYRCERSLRSDLARQMPKASALTPKRDCESRIGRFHPELSRLCWQYGNPDLSLPAERARQQAEAAANAARRAILADAVKDVGSRCSCASALWRREALIPLGIHAGTARMITLPGIRDREAGLARALETPLCAQMGGGLS